MLRDYVYNSHVVTSSVCETVDDTTSNITSSYSKFFSVLYNFKLQSIMSILLLLHCSNSLCAYHSRSSQSLSDRVLHWKLDKVDTFYL